MALFRKPDEQPEQPRVEGDDLIPPDPKPETEPKKLPRTKWA